MCGKTSMGIVRTTFIINEEGKIEKIFEKVKIFTSYPDEETLKNLNYRSKKEILEERGIVEIDNTLKIILKDKVNTTVTGGAYSWEL